MKIAHFISLFALIFLLFGCEKGPGIIPPTIVLELNYSPDTLRMNAAGDVINVNICYEIFNPANLPNANPSRLSIDGLFCESDTIDLFYPVRDNVAQSEYLVNNNIQISPAGILWPMFQGNEISLKWNWTKFTLRSNDAVSVEVEKNTTGLERVMKVYSHAEILQFVGCSGSPLIIIQSAE